MNSIAIMIMLLFVIIIIRYANKKIFDNELSIDIGDKDIVSPVDGIIVYNRIVGNDPIICNKRKDIIMSSLWLLDYRQIGLYMSIYDRHCVVSPKDGVISKIEEIGERKDKESMIDIINFIKYYYFGITPKMNITDNYSIVYNIDDIVLIVISDKYIGKITMLKKQGDQVKKGEKICKIDKGSQVDLFIPALYKIVKKRIFKIGDNIVV